MISGRVLCVDDEPRVLDGLRRTLGAEYDVTTAEGPDVALGLLDRGEAFAVVISDMRMPKMNGAALLAQWSQRAPDTVRILLTGHSGIDAAIVAVNEANVFRFLLKPCPPESLLGTVAAACAQHRLVTAERVLLEQTLVGSVRALTEVLALTHAEAFGTSARNHERARKLAELLAVPEPWHVEVASMLASIGYVVLPAEVLAKVNSARPLSPAEQQMLADVPKVAEKVVANIPRLERVEALLRHQGSWLGKTAAAAGPAHALPAGAQILRVLHHLDALERETGNTRDALGVLSRCDQLYPAPLLEAVARACAVKPPELRKLPLSEVSAGMVFAEDVTLVDGPLLVASGQRVTERVLLRLKNHYARRVKEPLLCEIE